MEYPPHKLGRRQTLVIGGARNGILKVGSNPCLQDGVFGPVGFHLSTTLPHAPTNPVAIRVDSREIYRVNIG